MDRERYKLIVAVDYGTTHTGISFITTNNTDVDKIEIINEWPGSSEVAFKVPSKIAYQSENPHLDFDHWGFNAKPNMNSYTWTKLLLDRNIRLTDFDDSKLEDVFGCGMMRLPPNKSAQEVVTDYLKAIYRYLTEQLSKHFRKEVFDATPMECWLTVPAIWSDAAKAATRAAAIKAGFASRRGDEVKIITEPEAAALAALKPHVGRNALDPISPGEGVLVCDCGGGTVDITTYCIEQVAPKLQFKELCVGIGGKCGSTAIDRNFNQWMIQKFGNAYKDLPPRKRGPGSLFMRSFEEAKKAFGTNSLDSNGAPRKVEIENLNMALVSNEQYDHKQSVLKITTNQVKGFFDPVIDQIIGLIHSQIGDAANKKHDINRIILVGGFGNSSYLNSRLQEWCEKEHKGMKLSCPTQCQSAIARGAVIRGLEFLMPSSRKARRHYGYSVGLPFRDGIDPEKKSYIPIWIDKKYCEGRMEWVGQDIGNDFEMKHELVRCFEGKKEDIFGVLTLFCCSSDTAPEFSDQPGIEKVGEVQVKIPKNDYKYLPTKKRKGVLFKKLEYNVLVNMASEQGTLMVKAMRNGSEIGSTTIKFDHD
ncbi:putative hsp70 family protein [Lasiodiplodia theobromae]|uniref:Hsp70 family protein n=1 Tax=Lasiodiplodia theobromae TaxID=45133 RepID=A0A8H7IQF0_9PEZI|nr:putative hsp70 family protein [Lasiodiplodia theobromae]